MLKQSYAGILVRIAIGGTLACSNDCLFLKFHGGSQIFLLEQLVLNKYKESCGQKDIIV